MMWLILNFMHAYMNFIHAYMHVRMRSVCPPPEVPPLLYTMLGATISELVVVVVAVVP